MSSSPQSPSGKVAVRRARAVRLRRNKPLCTLETSPDGSASKADPVLERRAQIQRLVDVGQRVGYGLFGLAILLFAVGFIGELTAAIVTGVIVCLVVGSIILAPAIVFGYGVKAANRDDREHGRPI